MTAFALETLHIVVGVLAGLLMIFMLGFIGCACVCLVCRPRSNGYAQRHRDIARRTKAERKRTLIITPSHKDPLVVGDVTIPANVK